jgi:hypothetical protein
MPAFSLTDAAFEGFRLTRERPRVVAAWAALYALMSVVTAVVMVTTIGPASATLGATAQGMIPSDPAEAARQSRIVAPLLMIMLPLVLIFWSVLTSAIYRAILQPEKGGFGRIRFGADELRMMGLIVILFLLFVSTLAALRMADALGSVLAVSGGVAGAVLGNLMRLTAFLAIVALWIRLSLAGPITYVSREIHVFRSWTLTKGHFWRLAATYGLAIGSALVVMLLALVIFAAAALGFAAAAGIPLNHVEGIFQPNMTSIAAYFTPAQIFNQVFSAILLVAVFVVLLSPAAIIHRDLTADRSA